MRRIALLAIVVVTLTAVSCGERGSWEGRVERWLLALNQGSAGHADRYAPPSLSNQILPNAETGPPGRLDVIEVGDARMLECFIHVPIRVVRSDGEIFEGLAVVQTCPTVPIWDIIGVERRALPAGTFPSEGGSAFRNTTALAWLAAGGIALGLIVVGEGAMRLARDRTVGPPEPRVGVE